MKWIIFVVFFAFAEGTPALTTPATERNITENFKSAIQKYFSQLDMSSSFKHLTSRRISIGYNMKMTFLKEGGYGELRPLPNGFKMKTHRMAFMEIFLQRYSHTFATEIFPINVTTTFINEKNTDTDEGIIRNNNCRVRVELLNTDHFDINLRPDDYKYKPNEEKEIKREITKLTIQEITKEGVEEAQIKLTRICPVTFLFFSEFLLNTKERYYTIDTIRTNNYTLNNVTIRGLWNVQSHTYNASNQEAPQQVEFGEVTGSMVQNFKAEEKEPLQLNFNASNVYIYAKSWGTGSTKHAKIAGYSFKNTKTNTFLEEDESKSIMAEIESAFAASLTNKDGI